MKQIKNFPTVFIKM